MAPAPESPPTTPSPPTKPPPTTPTPSPVPPPVPVDTHPNRVAFKPAVNRTISDPNRLAPEDAYKTYSPPRLRPLTEIRPLGFSDFHGSAAASAAAAALRPAVASLRPPPAIPVAARLEQERKRRSVSRKRRQPKEWKKLLWVKHPTCTDSHLPAWPHCTLTLVSVQIQTTTPIQKPSSTIFSVTHAFGPTTFGLLSQTRRSLYSMFAQSPSSFAPTLVSFKTESLRYLLSAVEVWQRLSGGSSGTTGRVSQKNGTKRKS